MTLLSESLLSIATVSQTATGVVQLRGHSVDQHVPGGANVGIVTQKDRAGKYMLRHKRSCGFGPKSV